MTEPGYYYTQLMSAIAFLEQCDASRLTITPAEYELCVSLSASRAHADDMHYAHNRHMSASTAKSTLFSPRSGNATAPVATAAAAAAAATVTTTTITTTTTTPRPTTTMTASAPAQPPSVDRFITCSASQLSPADVEQLLAAYRALSHEYQVRVGMQCTPNLKRRRRSCARRACAQRGRRCSLSTTPRRCRRRWRRRSTLICSHRWCPRQRRQRWHRVVRS
jgi:hypothetical protein